MYIYNYIHILRAARNVENPPANNFVHQSSCYDAHIVYVTRNNVYFDYGQQYSKYARHSLLVFNNKKTVQVELLEQ